MPTIDEIYHWLDEKFPVSLRCEWDNDGLMVAANPLQEVKKVLCCLDVTKEAAEFAIENRFDLIVSHHPLIFRPMKGFSYQNPVAVRAMKLYTAGIAVMSFHTRLDAAEGGVNDVFAALLGLTDVSTVESEEGSIARIGTLPVPMSPEEFAAFVKEKLNAERVLFSTVGNTVYRVAVCGGDGKDFIKDVTKAGADSYLSGQLSYNTMEDSAINLFEAGHFATEDFICPHLMNLIRDRYPEVETAYFNANRIQHI